MPLRIVLCLIAVLAAVEPLQACSIPVFRYALERWAADLFEVSVFYEGPLPDAQMQRLNQLEDWAVQNGGQVNLEVVRCDLKGKVPADLRALWETLPKKTLPYVVVRSPREMSGQRLVWQGSLEDAFLDGLSMSPARREIVKRLLRGDSVVWLMLRGTDNEAADRAKHTLEAACRKLAEELQLPLGVGKPGSELHSKIPLGLKFSIVDVAAGAGEERALATLLEGRMKSAPDDKETIVAPVFGRGRVLEVLLAKEIDDESVEDLTSYLCGACSCQVKQQNPGFDLLFATNWEERLFDDNLTPPTEADADSDANAEPTLVAIPAGNARATAVIGTSSNAASATDLSQSSHRSLWGAVSVFVVLMAFVGVMGLSR